MVIPKLKRHQKSTVSFKRSIIIPTIKLLFILLIILIVRIFVLSVYKVPSFSMYPTIKPGDRIIIWKMSYGPRVVNMWKLIVNKELDFHWYKGFTSPQKNDVIVFNWPNYKSLYNASSNIYGTFLVKRCAATGGDTILLVNDRPIAGLKKFDIENSFDALNLFPHDSTLDWTIDHYGPLLVPQKGMILKVNSMFSKLYSDVLLYEENYTCIGNDSVFPNGTKFDQYAFKEDYYFMIGDNFYNSIDSRHWGFVPKKNIHGKVVMVLFSIDPDAIWYKKFRWERLLKRIE